jgi:hypothetical protein
MQTLDLVHQPFPFNLGLPDHSLYLLCPILSGYLPQQLLLLMLQPKDVLLILVQLFQIFCLLSDFTIFVFFRYFISILIELHFLNQSFGCLLLT